MHGVAGTRAHGKTTRCKAPEPSPAPTETGACGTGAGCLACLGAARMPSGRGRGAMASLRQDIFSGRERGGVRRARTDGVRGVRRALLRGLWWC